MTEGDKLFFKFHFSLLVQISFLLQNDFINVKKDIKAY